MCSTATEGDQTTTPPACQNWERGDISLASQLSSKSREASGDGMLFCHSSREDSSLPFDGAGGNSRRGQVLHWSQKRKSSREQTRSQERQFIHERRRANRRSRQRGLQQQRQAQRLEVEADWKSREVEIWMTAMLNEQ